MSTEPPTPTLAVQLQEPLLVLGQLGPTRHLVNLPLQDGDLTVPPGLNAQQRFTFDRVEPPLADTPLADTPTQTRPLHRRRRFCEGRVCEVCLRGCVRVKCVCVICVVCVCVLCV